MPDVPSAAKAKPANAPAPSNMMTELKVSGHLMMLDAGLFCIVQTPGKAMNLATGLPGVRLSLPPGPIGRPEAISIASFRDDGWLTCGGDAALVRVTSGPAHLLVTIYQAPSGEGGAPNIQVTRLLEGIAAAPAASRPAAPAAAAALPGNAAPPAVMEMVAHIQERGDVGSLFGERLGEVGSKRWIEGFGLAPLKHVANSDIEYQAVLGRGWLSPWVEGGQFCGSRAMALPILGLRVRLRGAAAAAYSVTYEASFIDGTSAGPVSDGAACESEAMVAVESFIVSLTPRAGAGVAAAPGPVAKAAAAKENPKQKVVATPIPPPAQIEVKSKKTDAKKAKAATPAPKAAAAKGKELSRRKR